MALGWLGHLFGIGTGNTIGGLAKATVDVAEVFTENKTRKMELEADALSGALAQFGTEFTIAREGFFNRLVDGLNRLPRPLMALGTMGLFAFALIDQSGFEATMQALNTIPEPLWWLLGAVVTFYFGARESHHWRDGRGRARSVASPPIAREFEVQPEPKFETTRTVDPENNPALIEWMSENSA